MTSASASSIAKVTDNLSTEGAGELGSAVIDDRRRPKNDPDSEVLRIPALILRSIGNFGGLA